MSDASTVSSSVDSDMVSFGNKDCFTYPINRFGLHSYFTDVTISFFDKCKKHQVILNEYYILLAYQDSGKYQRDATKLISESISNKELASGLMKYVSKIFYDRIQEASEEYAESRRINLNWRYDGTRDSFENWTGNQYTGQATVFPNFEDLQFIYENDDMKDTERYFHFRAKKFYTEVYLPMVERMMSRALATRVQKKEEFEKDSTLNQGMQNLVASLKIATADD